MGKRLHHPARRYSIPVELDLQGIGQRSSNRQLPGQFHPDPCRRVVLGSLHPHGGPQPHSGPHTHTRLTTNQPTRNRPADQPTTTNGNPDQPAWANPYPDPYAPTNQCPDRFSNTEAIRYPGTQQHTCANRHEYTCSYEYTLTYRYTHAHQYTHAGRHAPTEVYASPSSPDSPSWHGPCTGITAGQDGPTKTMTGN